MAISFTAGKPESKSGDFTVKPGDYGLRVIEAKETTFKTGSEGFELKLRIMLPSGQEGPSMFTNLVVTEKAFWVIDSFLKSCGQHPGEGSAINLDAEKMHGWECRARLKVGKNNNGEPRMEIGAFLFEEEGF